MLNTRVLKPNALHQSYSPVSSAFPPLLQRRFNGTSLAQLDIEKLKKRCTSIFSLPYYDHVAWAGVYSPFFFDENSPYIEFIIGLRNKTNVDHVIRHSVQPEHFEHIRPGRRKIRMEHMYHRNCYTLKMTHGLLTAKTVFESSPCWLKDNRPLAVRNLVLSRNRLEYALRVESEITRLVSVLNTQKYFLGDTSSVQTLVDLIAQLLRTQPEDDPLTKSVMYHFKHAFQWIMPAKKIVQKSQTSGIGSFNAPDRRFLIELATRDLPVQMRLLRSLYMPIINKTIADGQAQISKSLAEPEIRPVRVDPAFGYPDYIDS